MIWRVSLARLAAALRALDLDGDANECANAESPAEGRHAAERAKAKTGGASCMVHGRVMTLIVEGKWEAVEAMCALSSDATRAYFLASAASSACDLASREIDGEEVEFHA